MPSITPTPHRHYKKGPRPHNPLRWSTLVPAIHSIDDLGDFLEHEGVGRKVTFIILRSFPFLKDKPAYRKTTLREFLFSVDRALASNQEKSHE